MMSNIHNRTAVAAFAMVLAVMLTGISCEGRGGRTVAPRPTPDASTGAPSGTDSGGTPVGSAGDAGLPERWIEYRNELLGIVTPYPDGWYVEENIDQGRVEFYKTTPPALSDMPADMWFEREMERSVMR